MKYLSKLLLLTLILVFAVSTSVFAWRDREVVKTFDAKELVSVNTVSSDCIIQKSSSGKIEVRVTYDIDPDDHFEPKFRERANSLRLNEKMWGSCHGSSEWVIAVPDGTRIKFSSASGEFQAEGIEGDFEVNTASGDIELIDCKGEFDLNTASGRVVLENCEGEFEANSASGDVEATDARIVGLSQFSTASGDVEVILANSPDDDLRVSTASGRAILDYNGNPINGYFEFIAKARDGRIDSPIDFDDEQTFREYGQRYVAKSFTKGSDKPEILIQTASGRAALKE